MRKENEMEDSDVELSDSELESESESEGDEDVKLDKPAKESVFNRDGLLEKLGDISWPEKTEWIHRLTVDVKQEQEVDVNDDLVRELAFYTQALEGTREAFEKLHSMGIPFLRPADYYAQMVKTDSHMEKVKGRLLTEKKRIEEAEERRKARESKKLSKEIQAQKQKERTKQKKDEIESVKKWRKQRQQSGYPGGEKEGDIPMLPFEEKKPFERSQKQRPGVSPGDRSGGKARQALKAGKKSMKKRDSRDSKFGFGGKKGMKKQNTADTTNDMRGFNNKGKAGAPGNKRRKF